MIHTRTAQHLHERAALLIKMADDAALQASITDVVGASVSALRAGGKIMFMGNGASAGDAQHLACDLISRFAYDRPSLAGLALTTDTSVLTAIGNDYGFDQLFSRQIKALGRPNDVVVGLTTSGRSVNILKGLEAARDGGVITVAMTGAAKAPVVDLVDHCIRIPSTLSAAIQEGHIVVGHLLCLLIEEQLFPRAS